MESGSKQSDKLINETHKLAEHAGKQADNAVLIANASRDQVGRLSSLAKAANDQSKVMEGQLATMHNQLKVSETELSAARTQQRINAQPVLTYTYFYDESGAGWKIFNSGLGASRLRGFRRFVDDKPVNDFINLGKYLGLPQPVRFRFTNPIVGERWVLGHENILYWFEPGPVAEVLREQWTRLNIQACYCSLYGDCWIFSSDGKFSSPDGEHRSDNSCSPFSGQEKSRWWGG